MMLMLSSTINLYWLNEENFLWALPKLFLVVVFLTIIMKQQKDKETDPIHNCTKKHKIPRNKPNQRCKGAFLGWVPITVGS